MYVCMYPYISDKEGQPPAAQLGEFRFSRSSKVKCVRPLPFTVLFLRGGFEFMGDDDGDDKCSSWVGWDW